MIDPALATTQSQQFTASLMYSGLMKFAPDMHVVPDIAVSIPTISANGRTYTFTIRQDARFADGRHCTAWDVAYSLARALSPRLDSRLARVFLGNIKGAVAVEQGQQKWLSGVRVLHRWTLQIQIQRPDAAFLSRLALPVAGVVEQGSTRRSLPGLGAWAWSTGRAGGTGRLVRRPHYYGGPLRLSGLQLVPVRDAVDAFQRYNRGEIDAVEVPTQEWTRSQNRTDFHRSDAFDAFYAIPLTLPAPAPLTLVDRQKLLETVSPELVPLAGIVPPAVPDYVSSSQAPVVSDIPVNRLAIRVQSSGDKTLGALQRALTLQVGPHRSGPPVLLVHQWHTIADPGLWLSGVAPFIRSRWFGATIARADGLTNDPVARMDLYNEVENWVLQRGAVVPLASGSTAYLVRPNIQGMQVTPMGLMPDNNNWAAITQS